MSNQMNEWPDDLPRLPKGIHLGNGPHDTYGDGACAMELVDYIDRRRQGKRVLRTDSLTDHPACSCPVIAAFVRSWNDGLPSDADRDRLLRPLLPLLLDTRADADVEQRRAWMACDWLVRVQTPAWLELAGLVEHAKVLRALPELIDADVAREAQPRIDAARAAAWAAARAAAWAAARAAARAAAGDAARAAARAAARDAARDAARAAARAAAWAAARDAARDALDPTVRELQGGAQDLVRRMCEVGR